MGFFLVVSLHQESFEVILEKEKICGKISLRYINQKLIFSEGFDSSKINHEIIVIIIIYNFFFFFGGGRGVILVQGIFWLSL